MSINAYRHSVLAILLVLSLGHLKAQDKEDYPSLLTVFEYSNDVEEKAKRGDSNSMWMLGVHNMPAKEREILNQVINLNDEGFVKRPDQKTAVQMIEKSANKGNPIAMVLMGRYELTKISLEKNIYKQAKTYGEKAAKWYEKAMKSGYGDACALIFSYKNFNPNYSNILYNEKQAALEYLDKGIEMKSPLSTQYMGTLCLNEPFDFKNAFRYLSLVEKMGFYNIYLTNLYLEGKGCSRNYAEAIKRVEAHQQVLHRPNTYMQLVKCFVFGLGVRKDLDKAYYYFLKVPEGNQRQLYRDESLHLSDGRSYDDMIKYISEKMAHYEYTPTVFEQDSKIRFTDSLFIEKRGGVYFITDANGIPVTHDMDDARIEGDSIVVMYDKYKSTIGKDGIMCSPIVSQMLVDWMQPNTSLMDKLRLENWICSIDANGEFGIACILQNNKGTIAENSFRPSNFVYKKGHGINKKIGKNINEAFDKGNKNTCYSKALPFYERAVELNPDFELAQMNVERMREALKNLKENETSPFMVGMSSVLQLANNYVQLRSRNNSSGVDNNIKQGSGKKKAKQKSGTAASAQNEMLNRNTYQSYVSHLIDMSTFRERYDDNQRKQIQRSMKQIRERYGFPKSEWEDWNGK